MEIEYIYPIPNKGALMSKAPVHCRVGDLSIIKSKALFDDYGTIFCFFFLKKKKMKTYTF